MTEENDPDLLETGDIFFLYRPVVNEHDPKSVEEVQRFYFVLRPEGDAFVRLCVAGRKRLPYVTRHERVWGFVDMVEKDPAVLEKVLREETYETGTRGAQRLPAARPAGEGVYAINLKDGQMHLSYALELPEDPDEVQRSFNIAPEASFALSVKNPEKGQPKGAGLRPEQKADYPERLQKAFRGRRFSREDLRLLDYEGAEFILVGARTDPEAAYEVDLETDDEDYDSAEIVKRLRMVKSRHPVKPLFEGKWD